MSIERCGTISGVVYSKCELYPSAFVWRWDGVGGKNGIDIIRNESKLFTAINTT